MRGRQAIFFSEVIFIANGHRSSLKGVCRCRLAAKRQRYILHAFYKTSLANAITFPARKNLLRLFYRF
nr:hypothetical protein FQY85_15960 [Cronobacter turicensis]